MPLPTNFLQDLFASTQNGTVEPQQNAFGRILAGLGGQDPTQLPDMGPVQSPGMTQADMPAAPSMPEAARPRRSVLDMIGGLADTLANVGGAPAQYQTMLDARRAREIAEEDRKYQLDNRPLEQRLMQQKLATGDQSVEAGSLELQGARNQMLGAAGNGLRQVFARTGPAGLAKAWPLIAQQMGIPDEQAAAIGEAIVTDPQGTLDALFPDPTMTKGGSKAKEIQIYEMLKADGDEETAAAYREQLASGGGEKPMTAYQREQVRLAEARLGLARDRYENPPASAAQQKTAQADEDRAAGQAALNSTLDELTGLYDQLDEMGAMVNPKKGTGANIAARARASGLGQLVEGAVGTQAQELRDRIESIRPGLMQQLAKATGMSSKQLDSNADVKLFMQTVTDPTRSYEANQRAIAGLRRLLVAPPRQTTPAPRRAPAPRQKGQPRQLAAPPKVGTVRQGYKFMGGDPANPKSWRKVQ